MANVQPVKPRPAIRVFAVTLGVLAACSTAALGQSYRRAEHQGSRTLSIAVRPAATDATVKNGLDQLLLGHEAVADANFGEADAAYRSAWPDPSARPEAADALHRLYSTPGFELKADEVAIRRNTRSLSVRFERYETDHFVLLSDSSPQWTLERGELLERAREQYFRVAQKMKLPVYPHRVKLVCILFDNHADYMDFARRNDGLEARWVAGYYATATNRVVFYNDATSPAYSAVRSRISAFEDELRQTRDEADEANRRRQRDRARQLHSSAEELESRIEQERQRIGRRAAAYSTAKTVHEAIHLLAFNTGMQTGERDYPFWLSEGLATCFETENAALSFGPDRAINFGSRRQRYDDLRRKGQLRPLRELVAMSEAPTHDAQAAEAVYSQSYALFYHLFRSDPESIGRYLQALLIEPPGRLTSERHIQLFVTHFGAPELVERRMGQ